jgi:hypothetical protein
MEPNLNLKPRDVIELCLKDTVNAFFPTDLVYVSYVTKDYISYSWDKNLFMCGENTVSWDELDAINKLWRD